MKTTNLIKALKSAYPEIKTDGQIAKLLGVTPGRISQWRANNSKITPRQVVAAFKRVISNAQNAAYTKAIRPIVELYPLERTPSREDVQ